MPYNKKTIKNLKSWKPGQSGNPKGRPKGAKNSQTILREMLDCINPKESSNPVTGETGKFSNRELFIANLVHSVLDKNPNAALVKEVMERDSGKVVDKQSFVDPDGNETRPIKIVFDEPKKERGEK